MRGSAPTLFSAREAFCAKEDFSRRGEVAQAQPASIHSSMATTNAREISADWQ
jgi:hypothetical protein